VPEYKANVTVPCGFTGVPVTVAVSVAELLVIVGVVEMLTVQATTVKEPVPVDDE